jgi:hypothetical protein
MALFKYTRCCFVESLLNGDVRFQPLSYYQAHENALAIGDPHEAMRLFRPTAGQQINNLTTGKQFTLPATFVSSVVANEIFVFCASESLSEELAREFDCDACVEICDVKRFTRRLQAAVRALPGSHALIRRPVSYYEDADPVGVNWALPELIVMSKRVFYAEQREYRFAFAERRVLKVYRTVQRLVIGDVTPAPVQMVAAPRVLAIGDIRQICSIHRWPAA